MIIGKLWRAFKAQLNKLANYFWTSDPIAQMQYEYDQAVEQIKAGKEGLAQYRALVEKVARQVDDEKREAAQLESRIKAYLAAGNRDRAAECALTLQKVKAEMEKNIEQLEMHEKAYDNNVAKIKNATGKVSEIQEKIRKYDAEIKMSRAEAEIADLAGKFNFDVTTDLGQIESILQHEIDTNRAKARVAADLSEEGLEDIQREIEMQDAMAEDALRQFEVEMGLISPGTANVAEEAKDLGPAQKQTETN